MKWNNGKERALFEKRQAKLRKEYLEAGMTEEQIKALYDFDRSYLNLRQREARHTQRLNITVFDEDAAADETKNLLLKNFLHNLSVEDKHFENERFGWIEQIKTKELSQTIKLLPEKDKELLTLLIMDGLTQKDLAKQFGVSQQAISKKIKKFQIIFRKWL